MKKRIFSVLTGIMFAELLAVIAGSFFSEFSPYNFEVKNYPIFLTIVSVIFIGCGIAVMIIKQDDIDTASLIFTAHLPFYLEVVYFLCLVFSDDYFLMTVVMFMALMTVAILVTVKVYNRAKRLELLKDISFVISVLLIIPIMYASMFFVMFSDLGAKTVVQKTNSPDGTYTVQVSSIDNGAMGGSTFADVYDNRGRINLGFLEFGKDKKRVFHGRFGEYGRMNTHWISDNELVIYDTVYTME